MIYGLAFFRLGRQVALAMGVSVFSHFALDLLMHPADLALWPGASTHVGFGLWRVFPIGWWFIELAVIATAFAYYWWGSRTNGSFGGRPIGIAVTLVILHLLNSPWLPTT